MDNLNWGTGEQKPFRDQKAENKLGARENKPFLKEQGPPSTRALKL